MYLKKDINLKYQDKKPQNICTAGLRRLQITEDTVLTPNLTEAEEANFNSCMPSSVLLEEKLIDEPIVEFEAPLVPLETPNIKIDDTDPNPTLPKDDPEQESEPEPKPEFETNDAKEDIQGIIQFTFDSYNLNMTKAMQGIRDRRDQQALASLIDLS